MGWFISGSLSFSGTRLSVVPPKGYFSHFFSENYAGTHVKALRPVGWF
jgi:hypothetical protein